MIKTKLAKIYYSQAHEPKFFSLFINPFYFARKNLFDHIKDLASNVTGKTLDVGCGSKPYQSLYKSSEYIGLEIDSPANREIKNADYFYDGNIFPFSNDSFDSVVMNQVFEHVFNPNECLEEVSRILKKDGKLLLTIPFAWDEHEQPYDFARYSSFGIKSILEKHGFEILEQRKSTDDIRAIFQLLILYIFKTTNTKSGTLNLLMTIIFISPFNLIGSLLSLILPSNQDLFLDNIILAKKSK